MGEQHLVADRQQRLLPLQRLADDAGEEATSRSIGLARPDHDRGEADADALDEAAPGIVGQQQFADRLLRAIAGQRRDVELVGDRRRERRAENAARAGEDELGRIGSAALMPDRLQQVVHAVEIDAVALVEIALGLAGDDRGQVEDQVRPQRRQFPGDSGIAGILDADRRAIRKLGRQRGRHHIGQRQPVDRLAGALALARQTLRQPAADHAGRPRDQDMHDVSLSGSHRGLLFAATRQGNGGRRPPSVRKRFRGRSRHPPDGSGRWCSSTRPPRDKPRARRSPRPCRAAPWAGDQ